MLNEHLNINFFYKLMYEVLEQLLLVFLESERLHRMMN